MPLTLVRTVEPATEPITLLDARKHCRVDTGDEDNLLSSLITAARTWCEFFTARSFITQTWRYSADAFPYFDNCYSPPAGYGLALGSVANPGNSYTAWINFAAIRLPKPPLQSVTSIIYDDMNGVATTLSSTLYRVDTDSEPARLTPAYGQIWPIVRAQTGAVRILYVAGYGAASAVPDPIKHAIRLLVGHWYLNREAVTTTPGSEQPMAVEALLTPYVLGEVR